MIRSKTGNRHFLKFSLLRAALTHLQHISVSRGLVFRPLYYTIPEEKWGTTRRLGDLTRDRVFKKQTGFVFWVLRFRPWELRASVFFFFFFPSALFSKLPLKTALSKRENILQMTHSDWSNLVTHTAWLAARSFRRACRGRSCKHKLWEILLYCYPASITASLRIHWFIPFQFVLKCGE